MKPNFALDLTHTGISLLHRGRKGWLFVGTVDLDDPDLGGALALLRKTATAMSGAGLSTKLLIPASQVLYTTIHAPGPSDTARRAQIGEALKGRTPYDLSEIVFDWSGSGPDLKVAAIARETLKEAEAFAVEHRFNPVSFASTPPEGAFDGEPFFGETAMAAGFLNGARVARDTEQTAVSGRADPDALDPADTPPELAAAAAVSQPASSEESFQPTLTAEPASGDAQLDIPATPGPQPTAGDPPENATGDATGPVFSSRRQRTPDKTPEKIPEKIRGNTDDTAPQADAGTTPDKDAGTDAGPEAPRADITFGKNPYRNTAAPTAKGRAPTAAAEATDRAPGAANLSVAGFSSRRNKPGSSPVPRPSPPLTATPARGATDAGFEDLPPPPKPVLRARHTAPVPPVIGPEAGSETGPDRFEQAGEDSAEAGFVEVSDLPADLNPERPDDPAPGLAAAQAPPGDNGTVPGPAPGWAVPVTRLARQLSALRKRVARPVRGGRTDRQRETRSGKAEAEAEALTVFGARKDQRARPRRLGLFLTLVLILLLIAVGIWSTLFFSDTVARFFTQPRGAVETAALQPGGAPEPAQTTLPPRQAGTGPLEGVVPDGEPGETPDDIRLAAIGPGDTDLFDLEPEPEPAQPSATGTDPATDPTPAAPLPGPAEVKAQYLATGVWQAAPVQAPAPDEIEINDIYVASIDPGIDIHDAIALPAPLEARTDLQPLRRMAPLPPDTRFDLDERGLVRATPQGAVTPQGAMVIAGLPDPVPLTRPDRGLAEPDRNALAAVRPLPRPGDFAEFVERGQLGGRTRSELAAIRPVPRPKSAQELATGSDLTPTSLAVLSTGRPKTRPNGFAAVVASAQRDRLTAPRDPARQVPVSPAIPTRASVAKQATQNNVISLRQVTLIGVFGSPSNRRALVRLPSGRYVKVEVGDRVDGGRVAAIDTNSLRYTKGGRSILLKMPKG